MKTKLEMAHEYAIALLRSDSGNMEFDKFIQLCWNYAEAMQAEVDKRLAETTCKEEWQPDWSQAPEWANWWVATANQGGEITGGWFYENEPEFGLGCGPSTYHSVGCMVILTDSFGYTGDWRDSLRKRPN